MYQLNKIDMNHIHSKFKLQIILQYLLQNNFFASNAFLYIKYIIVLAEITINYVTLIFVQIGNDNGHET